VPARGQKRNWADRLRPLRRIVGPIEAAELRRFGRSGLSVAIRVPVLLLETTGRRSGKVRSTPLAYRRLADGSLVVVGGAGGQVATPDWVHNLRADPAVTTVIGRRRQPAVAVELAGEDRAAAWSELVDAWPKIAGYEARAGHEVPVVRLDPT
jgi:deazaflavin-dependent oxidoreductase (nitroreductase family)